MIKPTKRVVYLGSAGAIAIVYGVGRRRWARRRSRLAIGLGLVALVAAAWDWKRADDEDKRITRNPEVMNGHFITDGRASAVTGGLADVEHLRALMGIPGLTEGRRRGNRLR